MNTTYRPPVGGPLVTMLTFIAVSLVVTWGEKHKPTPDNRKIPETHAAVATKSCILKKIFHERIQRTPSSRNTDNLSFTLRRAVCCAYRNGH